MSEPVDHTPAWLEWLKKPENLTTGLVLAAGLMQDRRPGQSKLDALGQVGLGTLAFRGGLQQGVQQTQERQREQASQQAYRKDQTDIARERNTIEQTEGAANRKAQQDTAAATIQGQKDLRGIPQAQNPSETDYQRALAEQARAQAALYGRMPVPGGKGSGKNPEDAVGGDLYEQEMFKQWATAEMNSAQMSGQPYVMDPMKWMTYIQPYRNAKIILKQMEAQGLPGEVYKDDKGTFRVRITGVSEPQAGPNAPPQAGGNIPPVELTPGIETAAAAATERKATETKAAAAAAEAARPATPEEMKPFLDKLPALSDAELSALMRQKGLPTEQLRVVRTELRRRSDAARAEKGARSQVPGLR